MDSFELELKQGFLEESAQLLSDAEQCFLSIESSPNDLTILEKIFRLAHNLKGSSKAVGFDSLGLFTHEFENLLLKIKKNEIPINTAIVTLLLKCNDHLKATVETLRADVNAIVDHSAIQAEVSAAINGQYEAPKPDATAPVEEETFSPEEINLAVQAEADHTETTQPEIVAKTEVAAIAAPEVTPAPGPIHHAPKIEPKGDESIRVSLQRLERLINFVGEMVILQTVLKEQSYGDNLTLLRKSVHQLGKVGKEIQDISMSLRMVPVKQTFQKMQRIVRDTSNALGKKVNLVLTGEETELDKTVLEALGDPLVHLIRNAVDHGIEDREQRVAAGKSEIGNVYLSAYHQGGKLVLEVRDDGGGINADRITAKAIEKGIVRPNQTLTKEQAVNLVFHPGFSTKSEVTEVSGRGVGMDVVKTNIESLQGEVQVITEVGKGSTFLIRLPLTLAIIDAMVVSLDQMRFVIPLSHVHESYRPEAKDLKQVTGLGEILLLRGENLPLFRLCNLLGIRREEKPATQSIALICRQSGMPFAVLVDDILGQHQVVIKKLGGEMQNLKGINGSAILGDGKPALILEMSDLIRTGNSSYKDSGRRATA